LSLGPSGVALVAAPMRLAFTFVGPSSTVRAGVTDHPRAGGWDTGRVIPTLLIAGLIAGRGIAIPLGGVTWASALLLAGTIDVAQAPLAALVAAANIATAVVARHALRASLRLARLAR
jgi:hypothetical protein